MKFKVIAPFRNWYGIEGNMGEAVEIPEHLTAKAEKSGYFERVRPGRKKKADAEDK